MKQVSIEEVETDLLGYLQQAEEDYVIITRPCRAALLLLSLWRIGSE